MTDGAKLDHSFLLPARALRSNVAAPCRVKPRAPPCRNSPPVSPFGDIGPPGSQTAQQRGRQLSDQPQPEMSPRAGRQVEMMKLPLRAAACCTRAARSRRRSA